MEQIGARLLDFSIPFDVALLDQVVDVSQNPADPQLQTAHKVLLELRNHPQMWKRVDAVLEGALKPATKFFGLQVLEDAVKAGWKVLPQDERDGIKNYVVGKIMEIAKDETTMDQNKLFLNKLNMVLVQILKQEWPQHWPTFISDIVSISQTSESICENNMRILRLLSEEVFDFSKDEMTSAKIKAMKESLNAEFQSVFNLCDFILTRSQRPQLIKVTLQTLQRFLTWVPAAFIFETPLIGYLLDRFFIVPMFRVETLECLTEIASLQDVDASYEPLFQKLYVSFLTQLVKIIPENSDLSGPFHAGNEMDCLFIQRLALFFCNFFRLHLQVLEVPECHQALITGMFYLVRISEVPEEEIFKICLDYWFLLAQDLYTADVHYRQSQHLALASGPSPRKQLYAPVLSRVRVVMISRMAKPEEVLVVEDENGNVVREQTRDTEVIAQYKTMRESLVYLTHLDCDDTESIMLEKLAKQVDGSEWGWQQLNTLCWAIGSISQAMGEEEEKRFLVTVIKDLLGLCEQKRGKDNKAVIASNIMYVVGQYPRFLRAQKHWKFLRTVVTKLFEFMHEKHPGVQDMACDTFLKIAQKCKRKFVTVQANENVPYIEELVQTIGENTAELEEHQVFVFYEAVATMLSEKGAHVLLDRCVALAKLMELPNNTWTTIMANASQNIAILQDPATLRDISRILRINIAVCGAVGPLFVHQLGNIFRDLINLYTTYSALVAQAVATQGEYATRISHVKGMRTIKKETLRLLTVFVEKSGEPEASPKYLAQQVLPPLLEPIVVDYKTSLPVARDAEVLRFFEVVIDKLEDEFLNEVPKVLDGIFECTLQMLTRNFEEFPEHRQRFYQLLKAVVNSAFQAILMLNPEQQKLVVDSIVWGFKHTDRNIAEIGLEILHDLLMHVQRNTAISTPFYVAYLHDLISDLFGVMTDRLHKSGFKMHATLLRHIFHLIEQGHVTAPLFDPATQPPNQNNSAYMKEYVCSEILRSFPNLSRRNVEVFVLGLFDLNKDLASYKAHLRDFLIQSKEFENEDNSELYTEERQAQMAAANQAITQRRQAVPGLMNPYELVDDMSDL